MKVVLVYDYLLGEVEVVSTDKVIVQGQEVVQGGQSGEKNGLPIGFGRSFRTKLMREIGPNGEHNITVTTTTEEYQ